MQGDWNDWDDLIRITSYYAQYCEDSKTNIVDKLLEDLKEYTVFIPCDSFSEPSAHSQKFKACISTVESLIY